MQEGEDFDAVWEDFTSVADLATNDSDRQVLM
jgi:hypothetical protein